MVVIIRDMREGRSVFGVFSLFWIFHPYGLYIFMFLNFHLYEPWPLFPKGGFLRTYRLCCLRLNGFLHFGLFYITLHPPTSIRTMAFIIRDKREEGTRGRVWVYLRIFTFLNFLPLQTVAFIIRDIREGQGVFGVFSLFWIFHLYELYIFPFLNFFPYGPWPLFPKGEFLTTYRVGHLGLNGFLHIGLFFWIIHPYEQWSLLYATGQDVWDWLARVVFRVFSRFWILHPY